MDKFAIAAGDFSVRDDGTVTYTPTNNFTGVATASYTVQDSANGTSNSATLTVTVTGGATPLARDDSGATPQNTSIARAILNNDLAGSGRADDGSLHAALALAETLALRRSAG